MKTTNAKKLRFKAGEDIVELNAPISSLKEKSGLHISFDGKLGIEPSYQDKVIDFRTDGVKIWANSTKARIINVTYGVDQTGEIYQGVLFDPDINYFDITVADNIIIGGINLHPNNYPSWGDSVEGRTIQVMISPSKTSPKLFINMGVVKEWINFTEPRIIDKPTLFEFQYMSEGKWIGTVKNFDAPPITGHLFKPNVPGIGYDDNYNPIPINDSILAIVKDVRTGKVYGIGSGIYLWVNRKWKLIDGSGFNFGYGIPLKFLVDDVTKRIFLLTSGYIHELKEDGTLTYNVLNAPNSGGYDYGNYGWEYGINFEGELFFSASNGGNWGQNPPNVTVYVLNRVTDELDLIPAPGAGQFIINRVGDLFLSVPSKGTHKFDRTSRQFVPTNDTNSHTWRQIPIYHPDGSVYIFSPYNMNDDNDILLKIEDNGTVTHIRKSSNDGANLVSIGTESGWTMTKDGKIYFGYGGSYTDSSSCLLTLKETGPNYFELVKSDIYFKGRRSAKLIREIDANGAFYIYCEYLHDYNTNKYEQANELYKYDTDGNLILLNPTLNHIYLDYGGKLGMDTIMFDNMYITLSVHVNGLAFYPDYEHYIRKRGEWVPLDNNGKIVKQ